MWYLNFQSEKSKIEVKLIENFIWNGGASRVKNKFLLTMIMYLCSKLALAFVYKSLYILSLHSEAAFYLSNKNSHVVTFNYAAKFEEWEGVLLKAMRGKVNCKKIPVWSKLLCTWCLLRDNAV